MPCTNTFQSPRFGGLLLDAVAAIAFRLHSASDLELADLADALFDDGYQTKDAILNRVEELGGTIARSRMNTILNRPARNA